MSEASDIKQRINSAISAAMDAENRLGGLQNHLTSMQRSDNRDRDLEATIADMIKEEHANIEAATGHIMRLLGEALAAGQKP